MVGLEHQACPRCKNDFRAAAIDHYCRPTMKSAEIEFSRCRVDAVVNSSHAAADRNWFAMKAIDLTTNRQRNLFAHTGSNRLLDRSRICDVPDNGATRSLLEQLSQNRSAITGST